MTAAPKHKITPKMEKNKWRKGQSGNPLGGQKHNPELKMIRNLTEQEVVEIGSLVVKGSIKELRAIAKDEDGSAIRCMIAAVAVKVMSKGDPQALEVLLNRLIGKVKEKVEVTSTNQTQLNAIVGVIDEAKLKQAWSKLKSDV